LLFKFFDLGDNQKLRRNWLNSNDLFGLDKYHSILADIRQKTIDRFPGITDARLDGELTKIISSSKAATNTTNKLKDAFNDLSPAAQAVTKGMVGTDGEVEKLAKSSSMAGAALKSLALNLAISAAIMAAAWAFNELNTTLEEYQQKLAETQEKHATLTAELEELSERKATSPFDNPITPQEEARLEYLEKYLAVLEDTLAIDSKNEIKSRVFGKGDIFSAGYADARLKDRDIITAKDVGQVYYDSLVDRKIAKGDYQGAFDDLITSYQNTSDRISEIQADLQNKYVENDVALSQQLQDELAAEGRSLEDFRRIIVDLIKGGKVNSYSSESFLTEDFKLQLEDDTRLVYELTKAFVGLTADDVGTNALFQSLSDRANTAGISTENLIDILVELGIIGEGIGDQLGGGADAAAQAFYRLQDLIADTSDTSEETLANLKSDIETALDFRSSEMKATAALKRINTALGIDLPRGAKQTASILEMLQAYIDGGATSFRDYTVAALEAFGIKVDSSNIQAAITTLISMLGTLKGEALEAASAMVMALQGMGAIKKVVKPGYTGGSSQGVPDSAYTYEIDTDWFKNLSDSIGRESKGGSSNDAHLEAYQKAVKQIQFLRDTDVISEAEYYRRLEALANQYLAGRSKYIDEYRSVLVDLHNFRKMQLEEQRDAELEALKTSTEARKKAAKEQYEAEKKTYEAKKKALQDELKAYKDVIDAAKEKLRQEEAAYDHTKRVNELNSEISDIESEMTALSLDDSAKANARKAELAEQLKDKRSQLEEEQYKYSNDLQEDALDREYERMEAHINSEIDLVEAALERIANAYDTLLESISASFDAMTAAIQAQYESMISSMQAAASGFALPYLSGQKNSQVGQVQQELINQGYLSGSGSQAADNIWGAQTEKAYVNRSSNVNPEAQGCVA
jgi:hypothetical protein